MSRRTFVKRVTPRRFVGKRFAAAQSGVRAARTFARRGAPARRTFGRNLVTAGFLGIEKKFYDTALTAAALTAPTDAAGGEHDPSATSMISTPIQGDGEENRDGKKIMIKSVQAKITLNVPVLANQILASTPVRVFVALVQDTQTNGAQIVSESVYKNQSGAAVQAVTPMRDLLSGNRFKVLKSQVVSMGAPQQTYDGTNMENSGISRTLDWFIKLEMPVNFNSGTTASVANVVDNSIHVIAYADTTVGGPTIAYNSRIRFVG